MSARGSGGGFLKDLNALRLDASANIFPNVLNKGPYILIFVKGF